MSDEFEEMEKYRKMTLMAAKEVKEACDYVSKICQNNIDIASNPFRFMVEAEKILENEEKINLKMASLGNFAKVFNEITEGDDENA